MKNLVLFAMLVMACAVNAQEFEAKAGGGGFKVDGPGIEQTSDMMTVDGQTFIVYKTAKDAKFLKCLSPKTGNYYPVWIGNPTEYKHEGRTVFKMKSGTYCVYKLSDKTGNPYAVYLNKKA